MCIFNLAGFIFEKKCFKCSIIFHILSSAPWQYEPLDRGGTVNGYVFVSLQMVIPLASGIKKVFLNTRSDEEGLIRRI